MIAAPSAPPGFEEGASLRQKARAAGLDPDYWYAVEEARRVEPGQVVEVVFWKRSIALFRGADGSLHAIENRCAHRQIKLSLGAVEGCRLVCTHHGWQYDGTGQLVAGSKDAFKGNLPKLSLRNYPVKVRYGLIWLFPGNPNVADERAIPDIPELEGRERWACLPMNFTWSAHHSVVIDNVCDFSHAWLHRRYRPFDGAKLTRSEIVADNVHVAYDTRVGRGRFFGRFVDHKRINTNRMELCYQYPYQWSNMDDAIKHWLFVLPIDERTTRAFFLFYFKPLKIPLLPIKIPRSAMRMVLSMSKRRLIGPLLYQDRFAVEAEQESYERHWNERTLEFNPAVRALQNMTVRKWREHLARRNPSGDAIV